METKIFRKLGNEFYSLAKNNDAKAAKEIYIKYLENAKESPSIAKLIFNDSLKINKDIFFKEARQEAKISGTAAPISTAVKRQSAIESMIEKIQKDKDVRPLQKQVDKLLTHMYKKTKRLRNKAQLTTFDKVTLAEQKYNRNKNWFSRFF